MERLVQYFRALSEEMRLRIVMLLTHGELCVCDIMEILDEPQSRYPGIFHTSRIRVLSPPNGWESGCTMP